MLLAPHIGEIAFLIGVVVFVRTGCMVAVDDAAGPSVIAMAWVLLRTLPFVSMFGSDALRDSVIVMYGGFTFFVIPLLLEDAPD